MAEDAGSVVGEIRLELDQLMQDAAEAKKIIGSIQTNQTVTANKVNKEVQKTSTNVTKSLKDTEKQSKGLFEGIQLKGVAAFAGIGTAIGLATKGIIDFMLKSEAAFDAHRSSLAKVSSLIQTTGASAWTTTKQLEDMATALTKATGTARNDILDAQAVLLGFTNITGENFERVLKVAIDSARVMGTDLVSAVNAFGRAVEVPADGMNSLTRQGFRFTEQEKALAKQFKETGESAKAQEIVIAALERSYKGVAESVEDAGNSLSRMQAEETRMKEAMGRMFAPMINWVRELRAGLAGSIADAEEASVKIKSTMTFDPTVNVEKIESYTNAMVDSYKKIDKEEHQLNIRLLATQNSLNESEKALIRLTEEAQTYKYRMTDLAGSKAGAEMARMYNVTTRQIEEAEKAIIGYNEQIKETQNLIAGIGERRVKEAAEVAQVTELEAKLKDIITQRVDTIAELNRSREQGLATVEDEHDSLASAYQVEFNAINSLITAIEKLDLTSEDGIVEQTRLIEILNTSLKAAGLNWQEYNKSVEATVEVMEELAEAEEFVSRAQERRRAEIALMDDYRLQIAEIIGDEKIINELRAKGAREALWSSNEYKQATTETRNEMDRLLQSLLELQAAGEELDFIPREEIVQSVQAIVPAITSVLGLIGDLARQSATEQINAAQSVYDKKIELLERERQQALFYAGFSKAQNEYQAENNIEMARMTGNHRLIYAAEQAAEELKINQEFDKKRAEEEEKYQKEKARIEYEGAMLAWQMQLASGLASIAASLPISIMKGFEYGPFVGAANAIAMAAMTATQLAAIQAAKPKLPKFADGGVVQGNSRQGDVVPAMLTAGEAVLNSDQQKRLYDMLFNRAGELGTGNASGSKTVTPLIIQIPLEGQVLASVMAEIVSNGEVFINSRGIHG
jgi:hypothetical protein